MLAHHASDLVAADVDVAAAQLLPSLAGPIDPPTTAAGRFDLGQQLPVGELAC
jgi:hypothetical protein